MCKDWLIGGITIWRLGWRMRLWRCESVQALPEARDAKGHPYTDAVATKGWNANEIWMMGNA